MSGLGGRLVPAAALALAAGGCSTERDLLRLQRDQLRSVATVADATVAEAAGGTFDPLRYDLYLLLNATVFDEVLSRFDNSSFATDGSRPIDITIRSVRLAFRSGFPDMLVSAVAVDRRSKVTADVVLDARIVLEGDPAKPDTLSLRLVATRVVPKLSWSALDFTRARFARRLAQLEATRLIGRIPPVSLPLRNGFVVGGPARSETVTFPTGGGTITGTIAFPSTELSGAVAVKRVLFLRNGVHVFADVEGL